VLEKSGARFRKGDHLMKVLRLVLTCALSAAMPLLAQADGENCGVPIRITRKLVDATAGMNGFAGGTRVSPFLAGQLRQSEEINNNTGDLTSGVVLYVQGARGFRAIQPVPNESAEGIYVSASPAATYVVTMITNEGPGNSFTLYRSVDNNRSGVCTSIPFPDEVNVVANGIALTLVDFNMKADGSGTLVGIYPSPTENKDFWFTYKTTDFGLSWSAPSKSGVKPAPAQGTANPAATTKVPGLERRLRRQAGLN
jgi:hypothetical protein